VPFRRFLRPASSPGVPKCAFVGVLPHTPHGPSAWFKPPRRSAPQDGPGCIATRSGHKVRCVSSVSGLPDLRCVATPTTRQAREPPFPQRCSYPPKNSTRQQPYRITAAVALLLFHTSSPSRGLFSIRSGVQIALTPFTARSINAPRAPVARCFLHFGEDTEQPTSRLCSTDESVMQASRFRQPASYPSMGFVPLQGLHFSAALPYDWLTEPGEPGPASQTVSAGALPGCGDIPSTVGPWAANCPGPRLKSVRRSVRGCCPSA
jgi:hypothetical protein